VKTTKEAERVLAAKEFFGYFFAPKKVTKGCLEAQMFDAINEVLVQICHW
jgi:hypothetical protein